MIGRPTDYSSEIAEAICDRLSGGESLLTICKTENYPAQSTVFQWLSKHLDFADSYARARECWADAIFEEILEISDGDGHDTYVDDKGNVRTDHEVVGRDKLRVDTRKWALARMSPKKYGDYSSQDINLKTENIMTDEQRLQRIESIMQRVAKRKASLQIEGTAREVDDGSIDDLV